MSEHPMENTEDDQGEFLSAGEVAARLGIRERQVYRMKNDGRLPQPVKLGGLTRWSRRAIADWVENHCPHQEAVRTTSGNLRK